MLRGTDETVCDRCGTELGNGSVDKCIIVADLDPRQPGLVRNLHFCRGEGCAEAVLSADNMRAYAARMAAEAEALAAVKRIEEGKDS